jgi:AcrR family transcriptional regulator
MRQIDDEILRYNLRPQQVPTEHPNIAKAASMTRQSVYIHFGSRGGLLFELVKRADERFMIWENFQDAMAQKRPQDRLDHALKAWFDFVPKIHPVASDLIRLKNSDEDAASAWHDRMAELRAFYQGLTQQLFDEGMLSEEWDAHSAADYIWASSSVQTWDLLVHERGWAIDSVSKKLRSSIASVILKK